MDLQKNKNNKARERFINTVLNFFVFLFVILIFHFFGGHDGSPWSWQEILTDLPMLIIVYLIVIFIKS